MKNLSNAELMEFAEAMETQLELVKIEERTEKVDELFDKIINSYSEAHQKCLKILEKLENDKK